MHAYIHTYMQTCMHAYIHTYTHRLEIGGIASPNANHFWGNCELLWHSDTPNFFGAAIESRALLTDCESFFKWIRKRFFFLVFTPF